MVVVVTSKEPVINNLQVETRNFAAGGLEREIMLGITMRRWCTRI